MNEQVRVWQEAVKIPTYGIGSPEKNPMFLEKRVYQGSSGVVYPHAVIERIEDEKQDKTYQGLFLENQYLKIMILPELGGRVQMAYDKVKNRHFVYYNQVIKPALVGLTGPWISGGIEFNWPQHHRPSTFEPVDFTTEEHPDGSKTVWVSEVERMFRTKGMAGFTLYPDRAYLEIRGVLYNRTSLPQTFLWWANPAVRVNDDYQSVFPPDVYAVFDHGRRDVSSFPIAKGTYYKVDYSPGTDISRYKNIPVPTSYMAITSKYNFMGGYEHDSRGGLLHVADHHVSPGKKQWTWGNGEFGYAWDRNLTDEDGPYIELMTGIFTDNQPDFSWIMPNEERTFTQYFMPYSEIGLVKNATREAAVNLAIQPGEVTISVYATGPHPNAVVCLTANGQEVFRQTLNLSPESPFQHTLTRPVERAETLRLSVLTEHGTELVSYQPDAVVDYEIPQPALAAKDPQAVENNEQLFLTGQHIEQYRHATFLATDYYQEALRRDPSDSRCNNAMGLWYYKRGQFVRAESYFRQAVQTLTQRNPNPYDGEPYYNLGLCLNMQGRYEEAYGAFFKSTWNAAWQDPSFLELARIDARKGAYAQALERVERSLVRNWHGHMARHLKVALLRKLSRTEQAIRLVDDTLALDPFNMGCLFERYVLVPGDENWQAFNTLMRGYVHNYIEYALDYAQAGFFDEATAVLKQYVNSDSPAYPIVYYFLALFAQQGQKMDEVSEWLNKASSASPDFVFPNRLEECILLKWVIDQNPADAHANYFLGNFWYANRQYDEAIDYWERSAALNETFPTVLRNLSLAYYNKRGDKQKALHALEKAFSLDTSDARVLMELDQLYKKLNHSPADRLALLDNYQTATQQRDDLYLERVTLYNQVGDYEKARKMLSVRQFHPWEGGEGKVVGQFLISQIELAKRALVDERYTDALALLTEAETYPVNMGEGKLVGVQENDIFYLKGLAYEGLGNLTTARTWFERATIGLDQPTQAIYYNDQQPDKLVYQGLAWKKLNEPDKATRLFNRLIEFGEAHLQDKVKLDYFAVSLPDLLVFDANLAERNQIHCYYLMGLGHLGLGNGHIDLAIHYFNQILAHDANHQGATLHKQMVEFLAEQTV